MTKRDLRRLLLAIAGYAHELEQILLKDERLAAEVSAAAGRMSEANPMWREHLEGVAVNHPDDRHK